MVKVIGVRFRTAGKIYFFDPLQFEVNRGDHVIVETARGVEYGTVVSAPREVEEDKVFQPLKPVLRVATDRDDEQERGNKEKEKEAFKICQEKIRKHNLDMKLIDVEYTFDNNKVLFYFTADGRIDFRELVKDLASVFKTRIELRQIGVRDETKILGGMGSCGRPLCCHTHLSEFIPVSIKMAKEQNLSLNPTKISGVCGRLMCCLKHEEETYEELNRSLPHVGDLVHCDDGARGEVQSVNVLRQLVKVVIEENDTKEIREYKADQLRFKRKHKKDKLDVTDKELEQLEKLEQQDKQDQQEKNEKPEKNEKRRSKGDRQEKSEHQARTGYQRSGNGDERTAENHGAEQPERKEGRDRGPRADRQGRRERRPRSERPERGERPERQINHDGTEQSINGARAGQTAENSNTERQERQGGENRRPRRHNRRRNPQHEENRAD